MLTESLVIAGAIVVLVILTLIGLMSRYRRCASDEILVVFGKAGKKVQTDPSTGKKETVVYLLRSFTVVVHLYFL